MLNRRLLLISLISCLFSCVSYYSVPPTSKPNLGDSPILKYRIALVGFHPFSTSTKTTGQMVTITAFVDYERDFANLMQIGKPVLNYPVIAQVPISAAEFKKRLGPYLSRVHRTGIPEMEKIFGPGGNGHGIIFKKRAVDYYFVAVHGPPFGRCYEDTAANLLSVMTFTTFPFRSICTSHTELLIMDSDFKQVGELNASTETERSSAWWYYFLDSIPGVREPMDAHALDRSLFRSDIYKLEAELLRTGVRGRPPIELEEYRDSQQ